MLYLVEEPDDTALQRLDPGFMACGLRPSTLPVGHEGSTHHSHNIGKHFDKETAMAYSPLNEHIKTRNSI